MGATIGSILSTARSALLAQQQAAQTAAHNISNAMTPGYSRQRTDLVAGRPIHTADGWVGTGVRVDDIDRYRDVLLDDAFRRESAAGSGHRLRHDLLTGVETAFAEPGDAGLGAAIDRFWAAWGDLANNPGDASARSVVREQGRQLAVHLNRLSAELDEARDAARARLTDAIDRLDRLGASIADLNRQIVAAEAGGQTAPDLRDTRDRLLDELATIAPIHVTARENGSIGVAIAGATLVDGAEARRLEAKFAGGTLSVVTERGTPVDGIGGAVGALLDVLDTDLPGLRARLDTLARAIVRSVNDVHRTGTNPQGDTDVLFFDDQGGNLALVTAGNIALSAAVEADAGVIAAGTANAGGDYQAGANDVALALAQLRHTPDTTTLGGQTAGEYYATLVSELGLTVASAESAASVHETLAARSETRRTSVSGVSTDEELIKLIQFQAAYSAAARVVTAADEMLQTLLAMG